ncbi:glycerol-3-phosphate 1-O-acyltransferase PlsY [Catenovulum maritimum]|uniref:Glycerol-3-phosphate acyltransferase n=1 Tax=Catenovulum maritimum TaxID=1513271 RepID=A0A0J8JPI5_9ALTE|nr:glycerol-3-phosphate 1-O-acyltransferase PlsY [Catenovulum maritimum]KMT66556.1 glycerol-3-phosphate acyltransferase [Catenovulum maritimum]
MSTALVIAIIVSYLIGSVSGARISSRFFHTQSPVEHGSKNPGATNMYRIAGWKPAALTMFLDVIKAVIAVYACYFIGFSPVELGFIGIACCIGHIFPVFYQFKGGKAVATAYGCMLPIGLPLALSLIVIWIAVVYKTRFSSLASIVAVSIAPLMVWFLKPKYAIAVLMLAGLIIIRHIPNINRLIAGTEPTIDEKKRNAKRLS